jgi:hypothetical protein
MHNFLRPDFCLFHQIFANLNLILKLPQIFERIVTMAQGPIKSKSSTAKYSNPSKITKKGSRAITPKKAKLLAQAKMNKKFSGQLTAKTEQMLGAKAGHLEILGQGRKKGGAEKKGKEEKKSGRKLKKD